MERILRIREDEGIPRENAYLRLGIPFPRGRLFDVGSMVLVRDGGKDLRFDAHPVLHWQDGSIRWVHADLFFDLSPNTFMDIFLTDDSAQKQALTGRSTTEEKIKVEESPSAFLIDNGLFSLKVNRGKEVLSEEIGLRGEILFENDHLCPIHWQGVTLLQKARLRVDVEARGQVSYKKKNINLRLIITFLYKNPLILVEAEVHNPHAAIHPGGMWDLGDPGSVFFKDFSIILDRVTDRTQKVLWCHNTLEEPREMERTSLPLVIYQDSSGGEAWDSINHIDKDGTPTVSFKGYRVFATIHGKREVIKGGERACPAVSVVDPTHSMGIGLREFWENFPSALEVAPSRMRIGLFPKEAKGLYELQGGEKKRQTACISFNSDDPCSHLRAVLSPVKWAYDPHWIQGAQAVPYLVPESDDKNQAYLAYIHRVIEGGDSFFEKREKIDEYGWRNFGDIYGDHEAVNHTGKDLFISHYNNQYDFVLGGIIHFLRSGDWRWWKLSHELARHVADIDIYHTDEDKAAYNHGMFWHTDHYMEAKTATHRCYSRLNPTTGGGPCNEQNYTTGLMYHYFISGDQGSRDAVLELAQWVMDMDDGGKGLFAVFDPGPTGLASSTADPLYHGPGRGAGNSINALLDAFTLTRKRPYLFKAEELIRRTIHPLDPIEHRQLDQPEYRWSYLVYLQVITKYLEVKALWGEEDWMFFYARDSLLHYVRWMYEHEVPYKDVLHKVDIPTETWPAQDIRKAYVFNVAARYAEASEKGAFLEKARFFFDRCIEDVLSFDTALVARPMVLLTVYGYVQAYFDNKAAQDLPGFQWHSHEFLHPVEFVPQRQRFRTTFLKHARVTVSEVRRILFEKAYRLWQR